MLLIIIALIIIIFAIIIYVKLRKNDNKIEWSQATENGQFTAKGNKNKFIISKDNRFEFIVEDGIITACKDKKKSNKFIKYGSE